MEIDLNLVPMVGYSRTGPILPFKAHSKDDSKESRSPMHPSAKGVFEHMKLDLLLFARRLLGHPCNADFQVGCKEGLAIAKGVVETPYEKVNYHLQVRLEDLVQHAVQMAKLFPMSNFLLNYKQTFERK